MEMFKTSCQLYFQWENNYKQWELLLCAWHITANVTIPVSHWSQYWTSITHSWLWSLPEKPRKCQKKRFNLLLKPNPPAFIPVCSASGTYALKQCHGGMCQFIFHVHTDHLISFRILDIYNQDKQYNQWKLSTYQKTAYPPPLFFLLFYLYLVSQMTLRNTIVK